MAIEKVFLGHERPALRAAADWLLARYTKSAVADLRRSIVVLPGSRAGRRLLELLVETTAQKNLALIPPIIETVGKLPEQLYRPKRPFATDLTQRLVWAETLRQASPDSLAPVIPVPPATSETSRWLALADLLRRQHMELAADGLSFADVAKLAITLDGFAEEPRWRALQFLQEDYLRRLDALELWDLQTARLKAVEFRECHTERDILLLGAVDLNVTMRQMLEQVANRVTALIFAPADWESQFDELGCLVTSAWESIDLPIVTDQVAVADGPAEQAEAVARHLASLSGRYRADEIVIGVPNEQIIPDIERRLAMSGVTARWGPGQSFDSTAPIRLLRAIAAYLEDQRYVDFAALVRHPDFERWLLRSSIATNWLEKLDEYQNDRLPFHLGDDSQEPLNGKSAWRQVTQIVQQLLVDLTQPARPLKDWKDPIWRVLTEIFGQRPLQVTVPEDAVVLTVFEQLRSSLQEFDRIPTSFMPEVTSPRAIRFLLEELASNLIPAAVTSDAIEMLGWLELPLDDAPALVITNFNEGFVPQSSNSDLFLPNALRRKLGLLDNARRYARDAYAVSVLCAIRESVHWIVGRRNHEGDPMAPSRLLFACDRETTAKRAAKVFQSSNMPIATPSHTSVSNVRLSIPYPKPLARPIERLNVTAFRDYLACPYRFYLRHVLRLEAISDDRDELDGAAFGSLAHDVLGRFGTSAERDSSDPNTIRTVLERELDRCAEEQFGRDPFPAVLIQVEQLRWRLRVFADRQAEWYEQGWRIEFIESPPNWEDAALFDVDGQAIRLSGRIDRIDKHVKTGERVILDYKTSDTGPSPKMTHRCGTQWVDLQLPLYLHMAATLGIHGPVRLGYIVLPKDTAATEFVLADWSLEELAEADEIARNVVRRIRREEFWPPADPPPDFAEDFAPICQDGVATTEKVLNRS